MQQILNYDPAELEQVLSEGFSLEPFRARQLRQWLYRRHVRNFESMTDISRTVRSTLQESFSVYRPELVDLRISQDETRKYLFRLADGALIETVLIHQPSRRTLCVSSQVGCRMNCSFCRTALMGLHRHLEPYEIVGQVLFVKDDLTELATSQIGQMGQPGQIAGTAQESQRVEADGQQDIHNIVFMGMGEPLDNYSSVTKAVRILNDPLGLAFSPRKITVSTSGLVSAIDRFGVDGVGANLAVSLNATTDEVRSRIMPVNRKWPIRQLLDSLRRFPLRRNQHITVEYVMLAGVNDSDNDLNRLPQLLRGIPVKLNLIPYNENSGLGYSSSNVEKVFRWQADLNALKINCRVRWSRGDDISAACGQLAVNPSSVEEKEKRQ